MRTLPILAVLTMFGCGLSSAQAGLLGMPMHLKSVAERAGPNKWLVPGNPYSNVFTGHRSTSPQIISC